MAQRVAKVPQVMQMEALECGAACLTMVLAYYGLWVPLEQVRADCGVSRDGSKAANILRAARSYGLAAKGIAISSVALRRRADFPCIVFWNFNHFVVVRGFRGKYVYLNDPARGEIRIPFDRFDESFTGIALVFETTDAFVPGGKQPSVVAAARSRLKGMGAALAFIMLTAGASSFLGIVATSMGKVFLDNVLSARDDEWLLPIVWILAGVSVLAAVASVLSALYLLRIRAKLAVVGSSNFMRHLLHLPVGFYEQRMIGDIQQRQLANETIAFSLVSQLGPVLVNMVMLVLYLAIMLRYSVRLTLVGVTVVVVNAFVARHISERRVNVSRALVTDEGKLYGTMVGGIHMVETIKAAGAEVGYFQRWAGLQANVADGMARMTSLNSYLGAVPFLVTQLGNIAVLVMGIVLIVMKDFTPGMLLAFQGFLASFMLPVSQFITLGQQVQEMRTQMERVDDVLNYPVDVPEDPQDKQEAGDDYPEKLSGEVEVSNLSFGYSPLDPPLIEDLNLHLERGQWLALVGDSGCGKSTVAKLVAGLYKPWSGEVKVDGMSIEEVPRSLLRSSLAVVDQDIMTFDDTVSENVRLWDRSIEDFDIKLACRDAEIHDVITARMGGYGSRILPSGRNFSGGQLQRLEIARALALDPTIIILDEATSALDSQTEEAVIQRIRDRDITCIVVAHRLSTIRDCDEIVMLRDGKVVERGTHEELLAKGGDYADLVRSD